LTTNLFREILEKHPNIDCGFFATMGGQKTALKTFCIEAHTKEIWGRFLVVKNHRK